MMTQENRDLLAEIRDAETTVVIIELTGAQLDAIDALELTGTRDEIASKAFSSALKSKFKYMRDNLQKALATEYDNISRRGNKMVDGDGLSVSKDNYIKTSMSAADSIFNRL